MAVLALRDPSPAALTPAGTVTPDATEDPSTPPFEEPHDVPALEALLPTALAGTALQSQSWDGTTFLTDDAWSASINAFLTKAGKSPADFQVAQAFDPEQAVETGVSVYRVTGAKADAVLDALIAAWKGDDPEMTVSKVTLDGKAMTKAGFGADTPSSYLFIRDDVVFDIEAVDDKVAIAVLAALRAPGAPASPAASASLTP